MLGTTRIKRSVTELDKARKDLRYEICQVAAAMQVGDRSADLSFEALRCLRVLVDRLDFDAVIESEGPEGWSLRSNESAAGLAGLPVPNAAPITPSHRKRSTRPQGGRTMPSSIGTALFDRMVIPLGGRAKCAELCPFYPLLPTEHVKRVFGRGSGGRTDWGPRCYKRHYRNLTLSKLDAADAWGR